MDEHKATQLAAAQMIDSLGAPTGFMIALRLIQVIAERASPKTPELIEAFAGCLRGMERFADAARVGEPDPHAPLRGMNGKANGGGGRNLA